MATRSEQAKTLLNRYRDNPPLYCSEVLGFTAWDLQADVMNAIPHNRFTATRSGHKIGKSSLAAGIALWWMSTRNKARVILSAPAGHQVKNIIWREVKDLYNRAKEKGTPVGGRCYEDYHNGVKLADGREIIGLTTKEDTSFAGISSPNLLYIIDEASGFPQHIFDSLFGNLFGGGNVLLLGNPTRTVGTFYKAFHEEEVEGLEQTWKCLHIRSTDTPNFHGGCIPGLADPDFLERFAKKQWGEGTPAWKVRILGEFPEGDADQVVFLVLIRTAKARHEKVSGDGLLIGGLDPARFGHDSSKLCLRRGKKHLAQITLPVGDGPTVAQAAVKEISRFSHSFELPELRVDEIGIGSSVLDSLRRMKELKDKVYAIGLNSASNAINFKKFHRLRDELWFSARQWLEDGGTLLAHDELEEDLTAPTYLFDGNGRYLVESKDSIKEKIGRSPDDGDAFCLCVWDPKVHYESLKKKQSQNSRIIIPSTQRTFTSRAKRTFYR